MNFTKQDDSMKSFTEQLRKRLTPYYLNLQELVKECGNETIKQADFMCVQWGRNFPDEKYKGLMFYGRATNGIEDDAYRGEAMLGDNPYSLFNRMDQMEWIASKGSPFVNLMRLITHVYYQGEPWYHNIAWSNVCKINEKEENARNPNPSEECWELQLKDISGIIRVELEEISPKVAIFVTGVVAGDDWHAPLLRAFEEGKDLEVIVKEKPWPGYENEKYPPSITAYKRGEQLIIITERPEFREYETPMKLITELIDKYAISLE